MIRVRGRRAVRIAGGVGLAALLGAAFLGSRQRYSTTAARPRGEGRPQVGRPAPAFALSDTGGRHWELKQLRGGRALLLFFCGCDRCRAVGRRIAQRSVSWRGVQALVIARLDPAAIPAFRRDTGLTTPFLIDPFADTAVAYDSVACPRCWVIDEKGRVAYGSRSPSEDSSRIVEAVVRHVTRS